MRETRPSGSMRGGINLLLYGLRFGPNYVVWRRCFKETAALLFC